MSFSFRWAGWWSFAVFAAAGLLAAGRSEGATLVFDQVNNAGTVSYDGTAGGGLVGTDIVFETIQGVDTDNDTTIDCNGCLLSFTTGPVSSVMGGIYTFAGGGTFTLVGGSSLGGIPAGTTLLTGTWDDPVNVQLIGSSILILTGTGEDTKHPDLLDFFFDPPLPEGFQFVNSAIQIESAPGGVIVGPGTAFVADLSAGGKADLVNSSVPEPGASALMLLGLGSLAASRHRRRDQSSG